MFDGILGNLDEIAGKLGLPADKVQALTQGLQDKVAGGGDYLSALTDAAKEHGVSLESIQGVFGNAGEGIQNMLGGAGEGAQGMLGKLTGALDKDGDGNPLNDLGGMVKGLFSKE
jgi:hypothetical protein